MTTKQNTGIVEARTYLTVNVGSTSKCYVLQRGADKYAYAYFRHITGDKYVVEYRFNSVVEQSDIGPEDYMHSPRVCFDFFKNKHRLTDLDSIDAVGFRVVAPGTFFTQHKKLDNEYLENLKAVTYLDPAHILPLLAEIHAIKEQLPNTPFYALSDSAFYAEMPDCAKIYALPPEFARKHDIYRFGYHGIACASIMRKLTSAQTPIPQKIIVCHLGGGASITAIKDGSAIDTSMGFSPLEGVAMSTRIGSIDATAVLSLVEKKAYTPAGLITYLYSHCGLLGLSGIENMREIIKKSQTGDAACTRALDCFFYAVQKYIGSYIIALGGLDLLVLTGGMAENIPFVRSGVCAKLDCINIAIDEDLSANSIAQDAFIQSAESRVKVAVLTADESTEMTRMLTALGA